MPNDERNILRMRRTVLAAWVIAIAIFPFLIHESRTAAVSVSPVVQLPSSKTPILESDVSAGKLRIYQYQRYRLLSLESISGTPSPAPSNNVNWDSPATWAEIATAAGIVTGGGTLFVGWDTRRRQRREEKKRQQQEWAVLTVETVDAVRYELDANRDTEFSTLAANNSQQRLELLLKQAQDSMSAFIKLTDPGDTEGRRQVLLGLHGLIDDLSRLTRDYVSVSRLLAVQEDRPGDLELRNVTSRITIAIEARQRQIRDQLTNLKPAIGEWLVRSDAIDKNVMEAIIQRRPPELPAASLS